MASLKINKKKWVFYNIEILDDFKVSFLDDIPVDNFEDTIVFMKKYIYNFQPALEMIEEMYNKNFKVKYITVQWHNKVFK